MSNTSSGKPLPKKKSINKGGVGKYSGDWKWNNFSSVIEDGTSCPFNPSHITGCQTQESQNAKEASEAFHLFLPPTFFTLLVEQTNLYAAQVYQSTRPPKTTWKDVTVQEMKAFIGMNIAMGVVNLPEINMYWSTDPILEHSWFRTILSRNRFKQILRFFHLSDNSKKDQHNDDKLYKVRPLIDLSLDTFKLHFILDEI